MNEDLKGLIDESMRRHTAPVVRDYDEEKELEIIKYIGDKLIGNFVIDKFNIQAIKQLIAHFNQSQDKGILLRSAVGSGKTILMTVFQKYAGLILKTGFKMVHVRDLVIAYNSEGYKGLNQYLLPDSVECGTITKKAFRLCVDDIGTESNTYKFYGTQTNLIEEFIEARYDIWASRGVITHLTTNLTPMQIKDAYGERVYSRMVEMMKDIVLAGEDRRR